MKSNPRNLAVSVRACFASRSATTTVVIRNTADSKDVVTATVDADGNRTDITLDLT